MPHDSDPVELDTHPRGWRLFGAVCMIASASLVLLVGHATYRAVFG